LQGSPLSPWLFNLFVDDLLFQVNANAPRIPLCLFYADDGVVVPQATRDLPALLQIVEDWTVENHIFLNPAKCAVVSAESDLPALQVYGQAIPRANSYTYLGFPVSAEGIDFQKHLTQRIEAAMGRAAFLGVQSNAWGPAHRLRVYKQYLAPMFEYGAPLVWAWAKQNRTAFQQATKGIKGLMGWISNTADSRWRVTANLCGLASCASRFQRLSTAYQLIVEGMNVDSPLRQLLAQARPGSFASHLGNDGDYVRFKATSNLEPTVSQALGRFLKTELRQTIARESQRAQLTTLIPMESRKAPGLLYADISLAASVLAQRRLLQYRRGVFMYNYTCVCSPDVKFGRGHEGCPALHYLVRLSRVERSQKKKMKAELSLKGTKLTNLDFLINSGQLTRVAGILAEIQKQLGQVKTEEQLKKGEMEKEMQGTLDLGSH
jgi:hypothetical protein